LGAISQGHEARPGGSVTPFEHLHEGERQFRAGGAGRPALRRTPGPGEIPVAERRAHRPYKIAARSRASTGLGLDRHDRQSESHR
jgi:hypothetical protein